MTTQDNYKAAVKDLTKQGIKFRSNVRGPEDLNMRSPEQPYGFTYGSPGSRIKWNEHGEPTKQLLSGWLWQVARKIFIYHGNESAQKIVETFNAHGINATWNGNESECIVLNIPNKEKADSAWAKLDAKYGPMMEDQINDELYELWNR